MTEGTVQVWKGTSTLSARKSVNSFYDAGSCRPLIHRYKAPPLTTINQTSIRHVTANRGQLGSLSMSISWQRHLVVARTAALCDESKDSDSSRKYQIPLEYGCPVGVRLELCSLMTHGKKWTLDVRCRRRLAMTGIKVSLLRGLILAGIRLIQSFDTTETRFHNKDRISNILSHDLESPLTCDIHAGGPRMTCQAH